MLVFEGGSIFTAFFTDIFSYISKTTGPILTWSSVTCSDGLREYTEQHKIQIDSLVFEIQLNIGFFGFFSDKFRYISKTT